MVLPWALVPAVRAAVPVSPAVVVPSRAVARVLAVVGPPVATHVVGVFYVLQIVVPVPVRGRRRGTGH